MINILNIINSIDDTRMSLYSPLLGDVNLLNIKGNNITVSRNGMTFTFNEFGQSNYCGIISPECLLFIKGKSWEEVFKSRLKSGDFLIRRYDYLNKRGITEFEFYYIIDINEDRIYGNVSGSQKLSDIDIDIYHVLDKDSDEAKEFYNFIVYGAIFDSVCSEGDDIFDSIITNLFEGNRVELAGIDYNGGGEFTVTITYNDSPVSYHINMNNRR